MHPGRVALLSVLLPDGQDRPTGQPPGTAPDRPGHHRPTGHPPGTTARPGHLGRTAVHTVQHHERSVERQLEALVVLPATQYANQSLRDPA